ncbi:MAG: ABC transporter ATP-binding protein [Acetivibrio sp.]
MLEIKDLYKKYGKFTALNGLNLELKKGELFGFVGPNGAGKTTTIKIISGLLEADSGSVAIEGIDIKKDIRKIKEKIGYMPDFFGVYDNLKTIEYMEFYGSIYGIEGKKAKTLLYELLELVKLEKQAENHVDTLSRGMKQRLCLARCLIHNPELLILDEPASGLDPGARVEMKEILRNLHEQGKTIIVSSHILPELAQMCSTIGIIQNGRMILKGTVEEISKQMSNSNPLKIRVVEGQKKVVDILKQDPMVQNITIRGESISFGFEGEVSAEANLLGRMIQSGAAIASFARQEGNLETLFMELTNTEREVPPSEM